MESIKSNIAYIFIKTITTVAVVFAIRFAFFAKQDTNYLYSLLLFTVVLFLEFKNPLKNRCGFGTKPIFYLYLVSVGLFSLFVYDTFSKG